MTAQTVTTKNSSSIAQNNRNRILGKSSFWQMIWITVKMAAINLVFTYLIALLFALPMAIASSPAAAIFLFIYRQKNGLLNELLGGAEIGWTTQMPYALWAVCAMTIWMHVGVSFIFLLVGFRNVSEEVLESARLDGAGPLQRVRYILLPMSSSQLFFVLFLNISGSFRCFAQIKLLTNGGPANGTKNLIYYIYENAIINGRFETACVQAMFLFLLILILTGVQFALEKKTVQSEQELGTYPEHLLSDAPTLQNYQEVIKAVPLFSYLLNSGIACLISIVAQIVIACLAAYGFVFFEFPMKKLLFSLVLMTTMIPGEVVVITNYTTIQSLHLTNTYAGLVVTSLISGTSIFLMREGSHLRTPAYRPQRYAVGENSTVCVKRILFRRSDGISDSWINSVI